MSAEKREASVSIPEQDALERKFKELTAQWKSDVGFTSSVTRMAQHPAYEKIIGMGPKAVPLLLRELERDPDHWFWALKAITGEDPVPVGSRGKLREMCEAWLAWGRDKGYCW